MAGFFFASFPQVSPYLGQQPGQVANLTQPSPHQRGMKLRHTPAKLVFLWCPRHFTCFSNGYIKPRVLGCTRLHMVAHGGTFRAIKHNYSQVQASSSKGKSCWGWILRNPNLATHASPSRLGHRFAFPHIRLHRGKPHFWSMCGNTMPSPSDLSDIILVSAS
jgi:hypothetical protein